MGRMEELGERGAIHSRVNCDTYAHPDADSDAHADANCDTDAHADSDVHSDADTYTDSDVNADSDTDAIRAAWNAGNDNDNEGGRESNRYMGRGERGCPVSCDLQQRLKGKLVSGGVRPPGELDNDSGGQCQVVHRGRESGELGRLERMAEFRKRWAVCSRAHGDTYADTHANGHAFAHGDAGSE